MMPNVTRGDRMPGLLVYLAGEGRHNEHTEPHLVAGSDGVMAWHDDAELSHNSALAIARHLDAPSRLFGTTVPGGHVWHCSLSLRAEEGELSDEKWGEIATVFVAKMGLDDNDGTKAGTRWVAVRHGLSRAGNDHIHIAVNLVREDGTKASTWRDFPRAQTAARELERAHGLQELDTTIPTRGYKSGELEADARRRARADYERSTAGGGAPWAALPAAERTARVRAAARPEQPRAALARRVRGCAVASVDEAQFVRRMRGAGLLVRPRFADGRTDVVVGYSVAVRPTAGERPVWYGGGRLAHDLTLPRLRESWPDTPDVATAAAAEWTAAKRGRRPVNARADEVVVDAQTWAVQAQELAALREQLRAVPVDDRETWARVAGQTAGAFAAWSHRTEPVAGPLAATADALSRSAHLRRRAVTPKPTRGPSATGTALLLMQASGAVRGPAAEAVMLRQLANLAKALHDLHVAAGQARRAQEIAAAVRGQLVHVAARLDQLQAAGAVAVAEPARALSQEEREAFEAVLVAQQGQAPMRAMPAPLPAPLRPEETRAGVETRTGAGADRADRGVER